jgi:HPt (histidine-containing phosphotransfer) domain-containing protein
MLNAFINLANETILQFNDSLEKIDLERIHKIAHKIKPSIENLQIQLVSDKIKQLEIFQFDQKHSVSDLQTLVHDVNQILKRVVISIESKS